MSASAQHPPVCMSRHFGNEGKPRPPVEWEIAYGCANGHTVETAVCDRCAASLVDGRQHCAECYLRMVVTYLEPVGVPSSPAAAQGEAGQA